VGWQHICLEAPENWSIGAVTGDASAGYLRLDDAEMPRAELRWEQAKGQEPIDKVVERYLRALSRKSRHKAAPVKVRRHLDLIKDEPLLAVRSVEGFHWQTEGSDPVQAYGALWRCGVCNRIVFVQVMGQAAESVFPTATRILATLRDHPEGDTAVWALYGMRFEVPASYVLKDHRLLTGRIVLRFSGDGEEVELERLSLAEMQLAGRSFEAWFRQTADGEVDRQEPLPEEGFRHPGVMASGMAVDPATVHKRLAWLPWRRPRKRRFDRCGWHCAEGNRLYTLRRLADAHNPEVLLRIARSMGCH
jgi:hypothetical protein